MGETHRHEAQIHQLRAVLRGISPLIWRRLLVRSDSSVAEHEIHNLGVDRIPRRAATQRLDPVSIRRV